MAPSRAHAKPAPAAPAPAAVAQWPELFSSGVAAWSEMARDFTQLLVQTQAAQARAAADLCTAGMNGLKSWPSQKEWLLMFENQAEQMADGVRHTLDDLDRQAPQEDRPILPD